MASNTRIPKTELTGVYGALVKRMSRRMFGAVPEPAEVMWHNRKVLNFGFAVGRKAMKWDKCDLSLKSFAHMAVACLVGCSFCLDLGYFMANNEGLDLAKAREVPRWRESDVFTPLERDVMEYAEAMTVTPPAVTDELSDRILSAIGPAAMVELSSYIALANFMTRGNVAMGIESQEFSTACGLEPLSEPRRHDRRSVRRDNRSLLWAGSGGRLSCGADAAPVARPEAGHPSRESSRRSARASGSAAK